MTREELQADLAGGGFYKGRVDGLWGPVSKAALIAALRAGADTPLDVHDFDAAAARLMVPARYVHAIVQVEAAGAGFSGGLPTLLFEPHRFSKATGHRFDTSNPTVSYPVWNKARYPKSQDGRYAQLVEAVGLDVDAGFASASYGMFQILGENWKRCGAPSPYEFAMAESTDEQHQLAAFEAFMRSDRVLLAAFQAGAWPQVAERYNGTAYHQNSYDTRLALAAARA